MKALSVNPFAVTSRGVAIALACALAFGPTLSLSGPAFGQTSTSAPVAPPTPDFKQHAAFSGAFEIATSRLALERSQNQGIKDFAQRMIADHTEADDELIVRTGIRPGILPGATAIPGGYVTGEQAAHFQQLKDSQGADFDALYIALQIAAHDQAVTLFENYAKYGDNWYMVKFAEQNVPKLRAHFEHAQQLQHDLVKPQPSPAVQPQTPAAKPNQPI